jgi:hypothetical protein
VPIIPPTAPHSPSSIIRGWYNRPKSGRSTKWTQWSGTIHLHYQQTNNSFSSLLATELCCDRSALTLDCVRERGIHNRKNDGREGGNETRSEYNKTIRKKRRITKRRKWGRLRKPRGKKCRKRGGLHPCKSPQIPLFVSRLTRSTLHAELLAAS